MTNIERRNIINEFIRNGGQNKKQVMDIICGANKETIGELMADVPTYRMGIFGKGTALRASLVYELAFKRVAYEISKANLIKYNDGKHNDERSESASAE